MNGLLGQIANPYTRDPRQDALNYLLSTPATTTVAPSPVGLIPSYMQRAATPSAGIAAPVVAPRPSRPNDYLDAIERQSVVPEQGFLGRMGSNIMSGLRGAGKELGGLFEGEEGRLRARELSKSLGKGPQALPISFGQDLAQGLAAGGEAVDKRKKEQAMLDMAKAKLAAEKAEKKQEKEARDLAAREKAYAVVSSADKALKILDEHGGWAAGFGSWLKGIPTTSANEMALALDTVKAQIGFKELQAMRDASKTGGALGQVTVRELELLQRTIDAIEPELAPEKLRENLQNVRRVMLAIANGVQDPRTGKYKSPVGGGASGVSETAMKTYNPETGEFDEN